MTSLSHVSRRFDTTAGFGRKKCSTNSIGETLGRVVLVAVLHCYYKSFHVIYQTSLNLCLCFDVKLSAHYEDIHFGYYHNVHRWIFRK